MKKYFTILLVFIPYAIYSQDGTGKEEKAFLDSIYKEMDDILAEMLKSKSFVTASLGAGTGFYSFKSSSTIQTGTTKKILFSPSISYLHKSGLSLSGNAFALLNNKNLDFYQYSLTPSYDHIRRNKLSTGLAYTRYFTKNDLPFYTTPIQNEVYAYFTYKKPWLQPGIALAYGWGNRTEFEERRVQLERMRRRRNPALITIRSDQNVQDLTLLLSVRHNFSWHAAFSPKDRITLTPVLIVNSGTQKFGFNTSFQTRSRIAANFLPYNQQVQERSAFEAQSASIIIRADYSSGIFFIQPQLLVDYYLHSDEHRLNNAVSLIGGIIF